MKALDVMDGGSPVCLVFLPQDPSGADVVKVLA